MKDSYAVLDLPSSATPEQVRERYKQLIRIYHPDRFTSSTDRAYAEERLKLINQAYTAIKRTRHPQPAPDCEQQASKRTAQRPPTASTQPQKATRQYAPIVRIQRRVQHLLVAGGVLLAGVAATSRLALPSYIFESLWHVSDVERAPSESYTSTQDVTSGPTTVDWVPIVSPHNRHMLFILRQAGLEKLYIRDQQSGRLHEVAHQFYDISSFVWSPDETKVMFMAGEDGQQLFHELDLPTAQVKHIAKVDAASQSN